MLNRHLIDTPAGRMTRAEAAKHFGINKNTLIRRIWQGMPPDKWFDQPLPSQRRSPKINAPKRPRAFYRTPWGMLTRYELCEKLGLTVHGFESRLYTMCWTLEETINTPAYGHRGKDFIFPPDEFARLMKEQTNGKNHRHGRERNFADDSPRQGHAII